MNRALNPLRISEVNTIRYPELQFEIPENWVPVKSLGKGTYGEVVLFEKISQDTNETPLFVAIKKIKVEYGKDLHLKKAIRELKIMRHLRGHPNIATLNSVDVGSGGRYSGLYMYIESMDVDLGQILKNSHEVLSDQHIPYIAYQLLNAMHYMHSAGIIHRDLKPNNVLITRSGSIKICDFGLARGMVQIDGQDCFNRDQYTCYITTRWYRPPEIIVGCGQYNYGIDIWSLGCIFAELITRKAIFPGRDSNHQLSLITETLGSPPSDFLENRGFWFTSQNHRPLTSMISQRAFPEMLEILNSMLQYRPEHRASASEILKSSYFDSVRNSMADRGVNDPVSCPKRMDTKFEDLRDYDLLRCLTNELKLSNCRTI